MKRYTKILLTVVLCGLAAAVTYAQGNKNDKSTLKFTETVWNFGDIEEAEGDVSHTFRFTNNGPNAIVIESVSVSCGCTTPGYSKKPVKPGEKGEITITFDPMDRPGRFSKEAYVISNNGKNHNEITVEGNVIPRPRKVEEDYPFLMSDGVRFNNLSVNFRYVEQNVPVSMVIGCANTSDKNAGITFEVSPDDGNIKVSSVKTVNAGSRNDITITAHIPEGDTYGKFVYKVYPVINGKKERQSFSISGIATDDFTGTDRDKAPASRISEYFHNFGEVKGHKKLEKEFTFYNTGKSPLVVRHISERKGISTDLKPGTVIQPGKDIKIRCVLDTSQTDKGVVTQVLTIITNDPARPMREIRLAADVK